MTAGIGDDAETCDLGSSSGGGVDGDHRTHRFRGFIHTLIIADVSAVGSNQTDSLCAVVGRTAAQGDDGVTVFFPEHFQSTHHVSILRVWLGTAEDNTVDSCALQDILNGSGHTGGCKKGIRYDQCLLSAKALHQGAGLLHGIFTE